MSLNDREVRRSNRLAGIPPPATHPYVVQHTTPIPPMPENLPPAPAVSDPNHTSHHSSDLLSESIHTYGHPTVPMQQPNTTPGYSIPPPNIQLSSSSHYSNDAAFTSNDHNEFTPTRGNPQFQHIRGLNTIPNFISSYNVNSPTSQNQHYVPPVYQYQAPTMQYNNNPIMHPNNNHQQIVNQFNAMQQHMQLNHQQQLRDLEYRFDQKLQQNTAALSQSLATTLGDTIKQHLTQHDGATSTSGSSSVNLIDIDTPAHSQSTFPQKTVQFVNPNQNLSSSSHHVHHQHQPTVLAPTQTQEDLKAMVLAAKEPKLYFPSYKPAADYDNWKMLCVLKTSKHRLHSDLVVIDDEGRRSFDQTMNEDNSSTLFMLTMEALGTHADKLSIDMNRANGIALWKLLDRVNLNIDTDVTNQETLSHQFEALKRENNEDYEVFALRFTRKLKELKYNGVEVTTDPKRLAFKLLRGLNERIINTNICMELKSKPEWYINISLPEIAAKAKKYMKHYNSLTSTTPLQSSKPSTPKADTSGANKPPPANPPKASPPSKSTPKASQPPSSDTPKPRRDFDEEKVSTMMTALRNTSDKHKYLLDLKSQDSYKFNSMETRNACTRLQCYPLWNAAARGIAPPPTNEPAPTAPAPAARRVQINETPQEINIQEQVQQALQSALGHRQRCYGYDDRIHSSI
jgi:hypothetical protein